MKRFSLRLEDDLHEKLRRESSKTGVSINEMIVELIEIKYRENDNMEKLDEMIEEVKQMQELLDHRVVVENEAVKLMEECKFDEVIELLATI